MLEPQTETLTPQPKNPENSAVLWLDGWPKESQNPSYTGALKIPISPNLKPAPRIGSEDTPSPQSEDEDASDLESFEETVLGGSGSAF